MLPDAMMFRLLLYVPGAEEQAHHAYHSVCHARHARRHAMPTRHATRRR